MRNPSGSHDSTRRALPLKVVMFQVMIDVYAPRSASASIEVAWKRNTRDHENRCAAARKVHFQ